MIRTVLDDLDPAALGRVDYHEHLFQVSPLLVGDELDDEAASTSEASALRRSGLEAMIDATPLGLGRDPEGIARISAASGLHVVATTGRHREEHYRPGHPLRTWMPADLAREFIADLTEGMRAREDSDDEDSPDENSAAERALALSPAGHPVRAGILKAGIGYWRISAFERETLDALATAHRATNAPVMVHLEYCTAAHEVLTLLGDQGVHADRVVLAHADRDPDPVLHGELAARGAYLGYDGCARPRTRSDAELVELTAAAIERGAGDRILLGGDVARRTRYLAYGGMPGLAYLGERYVPRLRERIGDESVDRMLVANPARLLSM